MTTIGQDIRSYLFPGRVDEEVRSRQEAMFHIIEQIRQGCECSELIDEASGPILSSAKDFVDHNLTRGLSTIRLVVGAAGSGKTVIFRRLFRHYQSKSTAIPVSFDELSSHSAYPYSLFGHILLLNGGLVQSVRVALNCEWTYESNITEPLASISRLAARINDADLDEFRSTLEQWVFEGVGKPFKKLCRKYEVPIVGRMDLKVLAPHIVQYVCALLASSGVRLAVFIDDLSRWKDVDRRREMQMMDSLHVLYEASQASIADVFVFASSVENIKSDAMKSRLVSEMGQSDVRSTFWPTTMFHPKPETLLNSIVTKYREAYPDNTYGNEWAEEVRRMELSVTSLIRKNGDLRRAGREMVMLIDLFFSDRERYYSALQHQEVGES